MKQWLNTKDDVEGKEGNVRYTLSKVRPFVKRRGCHLRRVCCTLHGSEQG